VAAAGPHDVGGLTIEELGDDPEAVRSPLWDRRVAVVV
jgi:hypothetical protein